MWIEEELVFIFNYLELFQDLLLLKGKWYHLNTTIITSQQREKILHRLQGYFFSRITKHTLDRLCKLSDRGIKMRAYG